MSEQTMTAQQYRDDLKHSVLDALTALQHARVLGNWPAVGPRWQLIEATIAYSPPHCNFNVEATVDVYGPEDDTDDYRRPHWRRLNESFSIPELPESPSMILPYFNALGAVLAERVQDVLRERMTK